MEPEHPILSLRRQCELLDINRSSIYYKPVNVSVRDDKRLSLMHLVDSIYTEYPFFGTRKMASYLQLNGNRDIKRHHIRGIYEQLGLRSVKYECVYLREWDSVKAARLGLQEYFEFYNNERPHQSLDGRTPYSVHYTVV